jgi:hypothetical protein
VTKKGHLQERDERTIGLLLVHIRPNLKLKLLRSLTSKDSTDLVPPAYMVPMDQSAFCGAHIVYLKRGVWQWMWSVIEEGEGLTILRLSKVCTMSTDGRVEVGSWRIIYDKWHIVTSTSSTHCGKY